MKWKFALSIAASSMAFVLLAVASANPTLTAEKHLFYLHGKIIEDQGISRPHSEKFGYYEYEKILEAFRRRGFVVHSEMRPPHTAVLAYAEKVAGEVRKLLRSGVPPGHISVVGASKGGMITIFVSALLQNRDINFVFISSCYNALLQNLKDSGMHVAGSILSIYDSADDTGCGSCQRFFDSAAEGKLKRSREIVLHMGLGHGILYRPLPEWLEPTAEWADKNLRP
jgi:hypothetical protein